MKQYSDRSRAARLIAALLLAWMPAAMLAGCKSDQIRVDVHLTYDAERDALTDAERGVAYQWASVSYEPAVVGSPYADWDDIILYEVADWDPALLLTEEWTGVGGLLYASDHPLPTLREMDPDLIYICTSSVTTTCIGQIDDREVVTEAVYYLETNESVGLPDDGTTSCYLKFASEDYAGIYYNIVYIERGSGADMQIFLYDRGTKKCVEVPYALFDGWMYSDETEDAAAGGYDLTEGDDVVISFGDDSAS